MQHIHTSGADRKLKCFGQYEHIYIIIQRLWYRSFYPWDIGCQLIKTTLLHTLMILWSRMNNLFRKRNKLHPKNSWPNLLVARLAYNLDTTYGSIYTFTNISPEAFEWNIFIEKMFWYSNMAPLKKYEMKIFLTTSLVTLCFHTDAHVAEEQTSLLTFSCQ